MEVYDFVIKMTEQECVAEQMKMYRKLTTKEQDLVSRDGKDQQKTPPLLWEVKVFLTFALMLLYLNDIR